MTLPPHSTEVCSRCERLSRVGDDFRGRLYLWFPVKHTLSKVVRCLRQGKMPYQMLEDDQSLMVDLKERHLQSLTAQLTEILNSQELQDTRSLLLAEGATIQPCDFSRVTSLQQIVGLSQSAWLLDILAEKRLVSYFQPIVEAQDPCQIFAQEALVRGVHPDGRLIAPGQMIRAANSANILPQFDLAARLSAIRQACQYNIREYIFINFSPTVIYDPVSCLRSTVNAVREAGISSDRVVFEVMEADRTEDVQHLKKILDFYREAGFLVALDDFGAGFSNLNLIHQLRPDFIKLDMELIRDVHQDSYKALITEKILEIAQSLNIRTIAEGVETPGELSWVQRHGATFVQGYLIAKPGIPPVSIECCVAA